MNNENNQNAINPNDDMNLENKGTNTFNLIIGIATLLIAILGATFAYFSATARSAENDVTVKSAFVSISYDGGTEINASNLIPSTLNVAIKKYQKEKYALDEEGNSVIVPYDKEVDGEIITDYDTYVNDVNRKCVDAKGKEVCYVYQFSIMSDGVAGEKTDIIASIEVNNNEFTNLSYILYEVDFLEDENGEVLTDKYGFNIVDVNSETGGYHLINDSTFNFKYKDTNSDNIDVADIRFDKFLKPYTEDKYDEQGALVESKDIKPVACLFGYVDDADEVVDDVAKYKVNDTARCKTYSIENKIKHTYQLVIWLEETGEEQPEQGLQFQGTVTIEVSGGFDSGEYNGGIITGQE